MDEKSIIEAGVPNHIAIILDGNGRWAKKRLLPRSLGHRKGAFNLRDIARYANQIGVKELTVFCFSTENWKRSEEEVNYLMTKPLRYFKRYSDDFFKSNIRISFIGRRDRLSKEFLEMVNIMEERSKNFTGMHLVFAVDYGSLDELSRSIKDIIKDVEDKKLDINSIDDKTIYKYLDTKDQLPLDLLIRTSGEVRISNFLLLQMAYSELYFTDVLWPDFSKDDLLKAIESYQKRNRRFGGIKEGK